MARTSRWVGAVAAVLALALGACGGGGGDGSGEAPPAATTLGAQNTEATRAVAQGIVLPRGHATQGWFEWGTDPALRLAAETERTPLGEGDAPVLLSAELGPLTPAATYYVRAVAESAGGVARGDVLSFVAASLPPRASTGVPGDLTATSARTRGSAVPQGLLTTAWFEWGTDPALASPAETEHIELGAGTAPVELTADLARLTPGVTCYVRVAAANAAGTSRGEIVSFAPPALPPAASTGSPDGIVLTGATLHGNVVPQGLATTGWFEWGTDPALTSPAETEHLPLGAGLAPVGFAMDLTGLAPGATYYVRAVGASLAGTSRGEIASFTAPTCPPQAYTGNADGISPTAATLRGTAVPWGLAATGWFEWGSDPALASPVETEHVSLGAGLTPIELAADLSGLWPGAKYYVRAVAASAAGTTRGEIVSFSPPALSPAVSSGSLVAVAATSATLRGTAVPRGLAATGWFEWGTDPTLASVKETERLPLGSGSDAVPLAAELAELTPGTTYYVRAVASSAAGTTRGEIRCFGTLPLDESALVVTTAADAAEPPPGVTTLRSALGRIEPGGSITFAPHLDGATIELTIVGEEHSVLLGEVFTMAAGRWTFDGFQERDYGRSALYSAKGVTVDASALPSGIRLHWAGGDADPARVLAVYGDLTMRNVTITGGRAVARSLADGFQPYTLARGGGLAVWGTATLERCTVSGNQTVGDRTASRDRGAFGGGIYGDVILLTDSVVSGNSVSGYGAAGGGVYSVGGAGTWGNSDISRSTVSGNRVTGQHAYGGGVYTDGGGPGNRQALYLTNCTVAKNVVEDHPAIDESAMAQYYYRGGGVYMSNGYLTVDSSTIAQNEVTGNPYPFGGKPNMAGGGIAATIGNAHVGENIELRQSIVVGNTVSRAADDVFTGSVIELYSYGYNVVGKIDFSQIHVPIPEWNYLSRRHWPKQGDLEGVEIAEALDLAGAETLPGVPSAGVDEGQAAVRWYPPGPAAVDRVPTDGYPVDVVWAGYTVVEGGTDEFLFLVREKLRAEHADVLGADFGADLEPWIGATFSLPPGEEYEGTWPSYAPNIPWISFWRGLDTDLAGRLGAAGLGDDFWRSFPSGSFGENLSMDVQVSDWGLVYPLGDDQLGTVRPSGGAADSGAIEAP